MKNNVSNIVLIGHMGSGKSTIGKNLAKKLSIDFVDTDYEIEKFTDAKISDIFLNQGENQFREIEEKIIKQILDSKEKKVIALGGGSFENKNIIITDTTTALNMYNRKLFLMKFVLVSFISLPCNRLN